MALSIRKLVQRIAADTVSIEEVCRRYPELIDPPVDTYVYHTRKRVENDKNEIISLLSKMRNRKKSPELEADDIIEKEIKKLKSKMPNF
jgi:hypothetical protein